MKYNRANSPFDPSSWPFFYGWMILVWGTTGMVMSIPGQTIGVSAFTDSLLDVLALSRDELSLAYMLGTIASSFLLPWAGKQYDRYGVRPIAVLASLGLGLVLLLLSSIELFIFDFLNIQSSTLIVGIMFVSFMLLRFFGQGVLTMVSRNMMAQWFEQRRGFAMGFSNVITSLSFSAAPAALFVLINEYTWRGAWRWVAVLLILVFPILVIVFFRNRPEDSGLKPDGAYKGSQKKRQLLFPVIHEFTLGEVRRNYSFWLYTMMLAMQGLYITAFTFHVHSIFAEQDMSAAMASGVFVPTALVAGVVTLGFSSISDYTQLKYLYLIMGVGAAIGILGLNYLGAFQFAYWMIVVGHGVMGGLFGVLSSVTWPRYFGRRHLGAISGQSIMVIVFASALGPILFSKSLSIFDNYQVGGWVCFILYLVLSIATMFADNPQKLLAEKRS